MKDKQMTNRYYGLDAFRCFAMLMGLVIHAPLIFEIPEIVGQDNFQKYSDNLGFLLTWIHSWRMPAFFILSGFFTHLVLLKFGIKYFFLNRFIRILIPLFLFTIIINSILGTSFLFLYHLWFLYYLFIISFLTSILKYILKLNVNIVKLFNKIIKKNIILFLFLYFILQILTNFARVNGIKTEIPITYFEISIISLFYHWFWFLIGNIFYYKRHLLEYKISFKIFIILIILGYLSHTIHLVLVFVYNFNGYSLNFISTLTTLIWIIVFIGVSNQYFNRNYKIVKYLIEISYPVYLIHLIPAIIFGTKLFEMDYNSSEIMLPNILVSGIVSIFSYYLFVKYTPINWFINGYNKSWFQPFKK